MNTLHTQAILTSMVRYGEAEAIVRVLTQFDGRMTLFCRSAFKPSKKRGSMVQVPARGSLAYRPNPHGMSRLLEIDLGLYTPRISTCLRGFALASYACELVEVLVPELEPHEDIFALLDTFLARCADEEMSTESIRRFEYDLLDACGLLSEAESSETDLARMAAIFVAHLKQHKPGPLKSLAFFKQISGASKTNGGFQASGVLVDYRHEAAAGHDR
ncbi:MAG: DNA repair protein RecO [Myxococcaceae bacterium]|nr:DNA repair protein RecO [Myxococcaceae bacterium]MBH2006853.1 DNA repair protein RecO [Myxococcaceae bacterium]